MLAVVVRGLLVCLVVSCQPPDPKTTKGSDGGGKTMRQADSKSAASGDVIGAVWEGGKAYFFELHSNVLVEFGTPSNAVVYDLDAKAEINVVDQSEDRTTFHLRVLGAVIKNHLSNSAANLDRLAREIGEGDCLVVLSRGRMTEFGLRKGATTPAAATFRQLASSLQLAPSESRKVWQSEEYDGTGQYVAEYTYDADSRAYQKQKVRYLALLGHPVAPGGGTLQILPEIGKSVGRIQVSVDGRVESVDLQDDLILKGAQLPIRSSNHIVLRLISVQAAQSVPGVAGLRDAFVFMPASEPGIGKADIEALDEARTQGATFRQILSRMEATHRSEAVKAGKKKETGKQQAHSSAGMEDMLLFDALAASLRGHPEAVDAAVEMIKVGSAMSGVLIDALGSASSRESEAALVGLMESGDADVKQRVRYALTRMVRPGNKGVEAMKALHAQHPYTQAALYALGSYSKRFADNGNAEKAAELGEYLIQRLREAPGTTSRITALRAIENSGYAPSIVHVQRFLDDHDDGVRQAAIMALRTMKDSAVDDILASRLASDISAEDKLVILKAVRARGASDELVSAVIFASSSSEAKVRRQAVGLLADWLPRQARLGPILDKIAKSDPNQQIRAIAQPKR